jgi:hypothetical protein
LLLHAVVGLEDQFGQKGLPQQTGWTGLDQTTARPADVASASSPGRRGELHEILRNDPTDDAAWAELAELDRMEDEAFGLLLEAKAVDGHLVKFFEPVPGRIVVMEKYTGQRPKERATDGAPPSLEQIWSRVTGGLEMPQVLVEAEERRVRHLAEAEAELLAAEAESPSPADQSAGPSSPIAVGEASDGSPNWPGLSLQHVTSSGSHFRDDQDGCDLQSGPVVESWCWLNRTGNWFEGFNNVSGHASALAMFGGNLMTWRTKVNSTTHNTTIQPGEFWELHNVAGSFCWPVPLICSMDDDNFSGEILDADVQIDLWHWGGSFSNPDWPGPAQPDYHPEL